MLGADHQKGIASRRVLDVAQRLQGFGKAARQALRVAGLLVDDTLQAVAGEHRYRRLAGCETALDRERLPARSLLVFGEAIAELTGVAERGAVDLLRPALADVADHELQCAADRGIGAVALAQRVALGVHADPPADRAVDDDNRPDEHR